MLEVAITFTNGSRVVFYAQEFDIDLNPAKLSGVSNRSSIVQKFTYKSTDGTDILIYLKPHEVAGIVTAYTDRMSYGLKVH